MENEKGKVTRGHRSWTKAEEDALIQCLTSIVNEGWKADNDFKAGFQREIEKRMRKLLPGTDISATSHINSKMHVWKKKYGILTDLLSKSGIGWNSTTYTLDIIDVAVWDAHKRVDPHVKAIRNKSWSYYESWVDIFGKDRATGEHAVDPINILNDVQNHTGEHEGETGEKCDELPTEHHESMSAFVETIGEYMKGSDETFNTLAQRMGTEYDAKIARTTLNDVMKLIPGLSMRDKLKVSDELVQNTMRLEYFLSLPQDEQAAYVSMLLDGSL
ncbi:hypothetical protein ACS0TY_007499 [Phlomoides rotata]